MKYYFDILIPGLLVIFFCALSYITIGKIGPLVIGSASAAGFLIYLKTGYKYRFDTSKVIISYLLTVIFFVIHVYEEYVYGFEKIASELSGTEVSQQSFLTLTAFIGPVVWITGAIFLIKQWAVGYYFLAFFFVAMTVAELTHFIFPFVLFGEWKYTAGAATAALPLMPAWYGLFITLKETKRIRNDQP